MTDEKMKTKSNSFASRSLKLLPRHTICYGKPTVTPHCDVHEYFSGTAGIVNKENI
jgi:hypothetical protein